MNIWALYSNKIKIGKHRTHAPIYKWTKEFCSTNFEEYVFWFALTTLSVVQVASKKKIGVAYCIHHIASKDKSNMGREELLALDDTGFQSYER